MLCPVQLLKIDVAKDETLADGIKASLRTCTVQHGEVPVLLAKGVKRAAGAALGADAGLLSRRPVRQSERSSAQSDEEYDEGGDSGGSGGDWRPVCSSGDAGAEHQADGACMLEADHAADTNNSSGGERCPSHRQASDGAMFGSSEACGTDNPEEDGAVLALLGLCGGRSAQWQQQLRRVEGRAGGAARTRSPAAGGGASSGPLGLPPCWPVKRSRSANDAPRLTGSAPSVSSLDVARAGTIQRSASLPDARIQEHPPRDGEAPSAAAKTGRSALSLAALSVAQVLLSQRAQQELSQSLLHARRARTARLLGAQLAAAAPQDVTEGQLEQLVAQAQCWEVCAEPLFCQVLIPEGTQAVMVPGLMAPHPVQWQACAAPGCRYLLSAGPYCCDHLQHICRLAIEPASNSSAALVASSTDLEGVAGRHPTLMFPAGSPVMPAPASGDASGMLHVLHLVTDRTAGSAHAAANVEIRVRDQYAHGPTHNAPCSQNLNSHMLTPVAAGWPGLVDKGHICGGEAGPFRYALGCQWSPQGGSSTAAGGCGGQGHCGQGSWPGAAYHVHGRGCGGRPGARGSRTCCWPRCCPGAGAAVLPGPGAPHEAGCLRAQSTNAFACLRGQVGDSYSLLPCEITMAVCCLASFWSLSVTGWS